MGWTCRRSGRGSRTTASSSTKANWSRHFGNTLLRVIPSVIGVVLLGAMASWVFARSRHHAVSVLYYICISGILDSASHRGVGPPAEGALHPGHAPRGDPLLPGHQPVPRNSHDHRICQDRPDGAGRGRQDRRGGAFPRLRPDHPAAAHAGPSRPRHSSSYSDCGTTSCIRFSCCPAARPTFRLGLYNFANRDRHEINWNLVFADIVLVSIPMIIVFLVAQRRIVSGLMAQRTSRWPGADLEQGPDPRIPACRQSDENVGGFHQDRLE